MKPIDFKLSNATLRASENYPGSPAIPVLKDIQNGITVSCWKMSWKERLKSLFLGKVWVMAYYHALPTLQLEVCKNLVKVKD